MSEGRFNSYSDGRSVSRRMFVKGVGASGISAGLAGCSGDGNQDSSGSQKTDTSGNGEETGAKTGTSSQEEIVLQWASGSDEAEIQDKINDKLHELGVPDNIRVEILGGSNVTDNRLEQYQQWLSSKRPKPDIFEMDSGWTIPFIRRQQLEPVANVLGPDNVGDILEGQVKHTDPIKEMNEDYFDMAVKTVSSRDGTLYGVPLFPDFPTMQYRKDLVENAGYNPEEENWATEGISWKKFSHVTKDALEQSSDVKHGYTFQANIYEGLSCCDFNEFMTSWGGAYFGNPEENLFGPVGDRPITVTEEAVTKSIQMVRTFIHGQSDEHSLDGYAGKIAPEAVLQWGEEPSRKPFTNGDVVMHRNWPYSININGADDKFGEDLGVMPIPWGVTPDEAKYPSTGGNVAALGGWHNVVNKYSPEKRKKAAGKVLAATMTDEWNFWAFEQTMLGWMFPKPRLFETKRAKKIEPLGRHLPTLKVAGENAIARPVTTVWPEQSTKIAQEVNASYAQDKSPSKAMSDLETQLKAIEQSV